MPSDPLPLTATGEALATTVEELLGVQFKSNEAYRGWLATADRLAIAIEQEARTLARAEVIAELGGAALTDFVWAHGSDFSAEEWPGMDALRTAVVAAEENDPPTLSRLGERE